MHRKKTSGNTGFTLVELLIVVIILALLAAVLVPQYSTSTQTTKLTTLDSNLKSLRTAIELYYLQHQHYPGSVKSKGVCTKGTNQEANDPGEAAFVAQITLYTMISGIACTQKDDILGGPIKFGPYLKKIPINPITSDNTITVIATGDLLLTGTSTDEDGGWLYDYVTGTLVADQPSYSNR